MLGNLPSSRHWLSQMAIKKLPATGIPPGAQKYPGLPAGISPGGFTDSAGFSWAGRSFAHHDTSFAQDFGHTPKELIPNVTKLRAAGKKYQDFIETGNSVAISEQIAQLLAAQQQLINYLRQLRLLVPLIAEAGDYGITPEGKTVEKTQELSIVTVAAADGRNTLPLFSSVAAMQAWNPKARPIPVPAPQAVVAAAQENAALIIIDPATPLSQFGIRHPQFAAVATETEYLPCWADTELEQYLKNLLLRDQRLGLVTLLPADPQMLLAGPETELVLGVQTGLDSAQMRSCIDQALAKLHADATLIQKIDSLKLRVVAV